MSNAILNWRFGTYHFKILRGLPYFSLTYNPYQAKARKEDPKWKWFEVMT